MHSGGDGMMDEIQNSVVSKGSDAISDPFWWGKGRRVWFAGISWGTSTYACVYGGGICQVLASLFFLGRNGSVCILGKYSVDQDSSA